MALLSATLLWQLQKTNVGRKDKGTAIYASSLRQLHVHNLMGPHFVDEADGFFLIFFRADADPEKGSDCAEPAARRKQRWDLN